MHRCDVIGKSICKSDACKKVTGEAKFAADYEFDGMLYAKVLRSEVPHALVKSIDTSEAEKFPGVVRVITSKDIPGQNGTGIIVKDQPVLVSDKIRYIGDAIAVVVAESLEIAEDALELIKVELEVLPAVTDPYEAMKEASPKVHGSSNILTDKLLIKGDVDEAFKNCDIIIENQYKTHMAAHMFIEPEAGVAHFKEKFLNIWVSTQNPHFDRGEVARVLNMPSNRIRVIQAVTGGGFGGKLDISTQCLLALATFYTRRPVKLVYDREESTLCSSKRHPYYINYKTGATKDGKILAIDVDLMADTGAYASYGPGVIVRGMVHMTGPYEVPNVRVKGKLVYTNNPMAGAMRGFGVPQVAVAHETQIEIIAERLNIDPWEIRVINALKPGSTTATMQKLESGVGIVKTLEAAKAKAKEVMGENL